MFYKIIEDKSNIISEIKFTYTLGKIHFLTNHIEKYISNIDKPGAKKEIDSAHYKDSDKIWGIHKMSNGQYKFKIVTDEHGNIKDIFFYLDNPPKLANLTENCRYKKLDISHLYTDDYHIQLLHNRYKLRLTHDLGRLKHITGLKNINRVFDVKLEKDWL